LAVMQPSAPKMWKYGTGTRQRSAAVHSCSFRYSRALDQKLPCESRQPLGEPVVPEV
jgi:hypothetical protein